VTTLRKLGGRVPGDAIADVEARSARYARHEPEALVADLFEQYQAPVFAYLYRLVGDREWAHDLSQEAFLQLFRARHRLPEVENQRAWVYRIATNLALNALKRSRRFAWLPWRQVDDLRVHGSDPAEQVDEQTSLERALAELPADYRAPLLLYSRYGFSVREVARALDVSEGAVKTRLFRAREMFRQAYERGDGDERA
jgi:RNA polymerase sigma-70 factor (ECF subfamily)